MSYTQQFRRRHSSVLGGGTEVIQEHRKWQHPHHFILMLCVSSTMLDELSNFPIRCFAHGKLIYFIIYAILYFIFGIPMVILECQLAQYFGQGGLNILRHICPLAGGIGIIQLITLYTYLLRSHFKSTVFINYVFSSMVFRAPWQTCGHIWSKINCYTKHQFDKCYAIEKYFWNNTCTEAETFCNALNMTYENTSYCISNKEEHQFIPHLITSNFSTPGWDYFVYKVNSVYHGGSFDVYYICNISLTWTVSAICLCKGIHRTGVQVSSLLFIISNSLLLLFLFLILLYSGGFNGIQYGFSYDFHNLTSSTNWLTAMNEVMKTLNIGFGTNAALASYNQFNTRLIPLIFSSSCVIIITNQLIYSFFVYALWGVASVKSGRSLKDISDHYTGLLAVLAMIPDLVQLLPAPRLWAVLYYVAILCKIIGHHVIVMEAVVISLGDVYNICSKHPRTTRYVISFIGWFISLFGPFMDPLKLVAEFFSSADFEFDILSMIELIIFGLVYGFASDIKYRQFIDLHAMLGSDTKFVVQLQIAYYIIAPFFSMFYLTLKLWNLKYKPSTTIMWIMVLIYFIKNPIIIIYYTIYTLVQANKRGEMFRSVYIPSPYWSPQQINLQLEYKPKHKYGSWKYKLAMLANHFGFQL